MLQSWQYDDPHQMQQSSRSDAEKSMAVAHALGSRHGSMAGPRLQDWLLQLRAVLKSLAFEEGTARCSIFSCFGIAVIRAAAPSLSMHQKLWNLARNALCHLLWTISCKPPCPKLVKVRTFLECSSLGARLAACAWARSCGAELHHLHPDGLSPRESKRSGLEIPGSQEQAEDLLPLARRRSAVKQSFSERVDVPRVLRGVDDVDGSEASTRPHRNKADICHLRTGCEQ